MTAAQPLVLMMAGGTGGHVYPALAVALELVDRGYRIEWLGTARGLESRVVPDNGIPIHYLSVRGLRGKRLAGRVLGAFGLAIASLQALWLVLKLAPRCVVGMGGYASGPGGVAAWLLRKPLLIHEQNAVAGTTNRMLAPLAAKIVGGFGGAFEPGIEYSVTGNPVRRELVEARKDYRYDYDGSRPLRLLVLGGSLGAQPINAAVPAALQAMSMSGMRVPEIRHQTGEAHAAEVVGHYGDLLDQCVTVAPFIEDMAGAYSWSDLVLCRCGALTITELCIVGRPAILVPLPHAIDDHQTANARALTERGGATLLRQSEMSEDRLLELLLEFIGQPERLFGMAAAAFAAASPDAAQRVGDCCEELMYA